MKRIPVEFSKEEKLLKGLVDSLSKRFKANIKEEEKELEFQNNLLSEYNVKLLDLEDKLEELQSQAEKIKSYYFSGMSEIDLNNEEERNNFIANSALGVVQLNEGIRISIEYGKLLNESIKIEADIKTIKSVINELKKSKCNKIADINYKKRLFVAKYTNKINNVIEPLREKLQKLKIAFVGDNVSLKSNEILTSLTLKTLKELDEISILISMQESESKKNEENQIILDSQEKKLNTLEETYEKDINPVDEEILKEGIYEQKQMHSLAAQNIMKLTALKERTNDLGMTSYESAIMREIECSLTWESYYLLQSRDDRNIIEKLLNDKKNSEFEISSTKDDIAKSQIDVFSSDEHLNYLNNLLLVKLNMILGEENLTIEEAKEKLSEEIENTPYVVRNLKK